MTTATAQRATSDQIADMKMLLGKLEARGKNMADTRASLNECWATELFTVDFAASMIKLMLDLGAELDLATAPAPIVPTTVAAGRYAVPTADGHYAFYRVWKGYRATLVFLLASDDERRLGRGATNAVLAKIAADPYEASCAYGREIGVCGRCSRTLTNPTSITRGMGDICASKF